MPQLRWRPSPVITVGFSYVPLLLLTNGAQQVVLEVDVERRAVRQLQQLPHFIVK